MLSDRAEMLRYLRRRRWSHSVSPDWINPGSSMARRNEMAWTRFICAGVYKRRISSGLFTWAWHASCKLSPVSVGQKFGLDATNFLNAEKTYECWFSSPESRRLTNCSVEHQITSDGFVRKFDTKVLSVVFLYCSNGAFCCIFGRPEAPTDLSL